MSLLQRNSTCLQTFPATCLPKERCLSHKKATATLRQAVISNLCLLPMDIYTKALMVALAPELSAQIVMTMLTSTPGPENTVHTPILLKRMFWIRHCPASWSRCPKRLTWHILPKMPLPWRAWCRQQRERDVPFPPTMRG